MTTAPPPQPNDLYRLAAPIYDLATALWSGGAIWRSRVHCLGRLRAGQRVLIPGPGTGRLAVEAARRGAAVTAVERSRVMARRLESRARRGLGDARFRAASDLAETTEAPAGTLLLLRCDIEELPACATFDLIVAEHFLNVFQPSEMAPMRSRLIDRLAPGGCLAISDFTPIRADAPAPLRYLQRLHHIVPLGGCSLLTSNAMHAVYDHGADLSARGDLRKAHEQDFRSFGVGPGWFRTWIFEKMAGHE